METIQVEYSYTKEFARSATSRFFWRYSRPALILAILVVVVGGVRLFNGWNDWFTGFCLMFPLLYVAAWYSYRRRSEKLATALRDPHMTLLIEQTGLTVRNRDHSGSMTWAGTKEVWLFPELWLLFPYGVGASFTAIPTTTLSDRAREFILSKLRENDARIVA